MIDRAILVCLVASVGVVGCGSSDGGGTGGEAGEGGTGGAAGAGRRGGDRGSGGGGDGGMGGEGGGAGQVGPIFTSSRDWTDAELAYQLESCQCQGPGEPISESACLALADNLPFSDRQNKCLDTVILEEENGIMLEERFAYLIEVDFEAVDCLTEVNECSESAIRDCLDARAMRQSQNRPHASIIDLINGCTKTSAADGVDAFLDLLEARCDCITSCMNADRDPEVVQCMVDTLQAEVDMLGLEGANALECVTKFWRQRAVCFGNEVTCDGAETACSDIPPPDPACAISGAILDDCLTL